MVFEQLPAKEICVFGDSIAWGAFDFEKGGWVERLKMDLAQDREKFVYNLGISGETTKELRLRFENEAKVRRPAMVIFQIGVNDAALVSGEDRLLTDPSVFEANLLALISQSATIAQNTFCLGLMHVDESKTMPVSWDPRVSYTNDSIDTYNTIIKKVCLETKAQYVGLQEVVKVEDLIDGLHPNAGGHEKIYQVVKNLVENKLADAR